MEKAIDKLGQSLIARAAGMMLDANLQLEVSQALLREAIWKEALRRTGGNKSKAAAMIGVHRNTFTRGLSPEARGHYKLATLRLVGKSGH